MYRVLIVEDNPNIRAALTVRLQATGLTVASEASASAGLDRAIQFQPDLLLLDISIQGGTGFDVASAVQRHFPKPPHVIFLTASRQPELAKRAQQFRPAGFVEKPFETRELINLILGALAQPRAA